MQKLLTLVFLHSFLVCNAQVISPGLTAVYEDKLQKVKLKWNHNDNRVKAYILQRSSDKIEWIDLYHVFIAQPRQYKFISYTDEKPASGKNYYRLKIQLPQDVNNFTDPFLVIIGKPGNDWLMYPVPVRDILNLQYNGSNLIVGVINITIQNIATGQIFHRLRMASTNRQIQIPVNNLGKGMYSIKIEINNQIVWRKQFIK